MTLMFDLITWFYAGLFHVSFWMGTFILAALTLSLSVIFLPFVVIMIAWKKICSKRTGPSVLAKFDEGLCEKLELELIETRTCSQNAELASNW